MGEENKEEDDLLTITSGDAWYPYDWSVGKVWSRFFRELRDNKRIMGLRCPECENVYVPPRSVCPRCFVEMNDWKEVGNEGTIKAYTVVRFPYINPNTGEDIDIPRPDIMIQLDGSDTRLLHKCDVAEESKIEVGMRAKAVFAEDRNGSIHDIKHFKLLDK